jgi:hypothetical protein
MDTLLLLPWRLQLSFATFFVLADAGVLVAIGTSCFYCSFVLLWSWHFCNWFSHLRRAILFLLFQFLVYHRVQCKSGDSMPFPETWQVLLSIIIIPDKFYCPSSRINSWKKSYVTCRGVLLKLPYMEDCDSTQQQMLFSGLEHEQILGRSYCRRGKIENVYIVKK